MKNNLPLYNSNDISYLRTKVGKNVIQLHYPIGFVQVVNGVRMTLLDNGTIRCEGNPTDSSQQLIYWITAGNISYPYRVRLEGLPDNNKIMFGGYNIYAAYNGKVIAANTSFSLAILIDGTVQTDGMILTPMVIPDCIADNTFESPSKDNITLTNDINKCINTKTYRHINQFYQLINIEYHSIYLMIIQSYSPLNISAPTSSLYILQFGERSTDPDVQATNYGIYNVKEASNSTYNLTSMELYDLPSNRYKINFNMNGNRIIILYRLGYSELN